MSPLLCLTGQWDGGHDRAFNAHSAHVNTIEMDNCHVYLAIIAQACGRRDEGWRHVRALLPVEMMTEPGTVELWETLDAAGGGPTRAHAGDVALAFEWLTVHDRWLAWSGAVLGQVEGHLGWARYERQTGDLDAAEAHAHARSRRPATRASRGTDRRHRLLGELATERGTTRALRLTCPRRWRSPSLRCPFERALTLVAQAELAFATGADAHDLLAEARTICERLEARPTVERIMALEARIGGRT